MIYSKPLRPVGICLVGNPASNINCCYKRAAVFMYGRMHSSFYYGEKRTAVQLTETGQQPAPPRALLCTSEYLTSMHEILFKLAAQSLRLLLIYESI